MSTITDAPSDVSPDDDIVEVHRRTIDKLLIAGGAIAAIVFVVAGGLLLWGANFSNDYVRGELTSQRVFFPEQAELEEEGRTDLVPFAGQQVETGAQAEAYASFIDGHLQTIGGGKTYAEIDDRTAALAVTEATASGAPADEVAGLQKTADQLKGQRDTLFKGETLRALLLSAFAWSTVGRIAGIAAWVAIAGAIALAALCTAGIVHLKRAGTTARA